MNCDSFDSSIICFSNFTIRSFYCFTFSFRNSFLVRHPKYMPSLNLLPKLRFKTLNATFRCFLLQNFYILIAAFSFSYFDKIAFTFTNVFQNITLRTSALNLNLAVYFGLDLSILTSKLSSLIAFLISFYRSIDSICSIWFLFDVTDILFARFLLIRDLGLLLLLYICIQ